MPARIGNQKHPADLVKAVKFSLKAPNTDYNDCGHKFIETSEITEKLGKTCHFAFFYDNFIAHCENYWQPFGF